MRLWAGTSGFSYPEWRGSFYPADLPDGDMLRHYGARLRAVEINNTFYRMPRSEVLARWAETVPQEFRFVLKASRRITHQARLEDAGDAVAYLWKVCAALGERLGPILFQTPPNLKLDLPRLEAFLAALPEGCRAAFELRHPSWADDRTFALLRSGDHAWCVADAEQGDDPPLVATARWIYLRLRRPGYDDADLARWLERLDAAGLDEAYVFFKHEEEGAAPALAGRMTALLD